MAGCAGACHFLRLRRTAVQKSCRQDKYMQDPRHNEETVETSHNKGKDNQTQERQGRRAAPDSHEGYKLLSVVPSRLLSQTPIRPRRPRGESASVTRKILPLGEGWCPHSFPPFPVAEVKENASLCKKAKGGGDACLAALGGGEPFQQDFCSHGEKRLLQIFRLPFSLVKMHWKQGILTKGSPKGCIKTADQNVHSGALRMQGK